jgi:CDP-glucose 4,6-dehydratase
MTRTGGDVWAGRPCLVTGAAGFGGSHLCSTLLGLGARVYALDRVFPRTSFLTLQGLAARVDFVQGDIRNLDLMRSILERFEIDAVFHLAAQPIAPMSNVIPLETLSVNAMGTYTVLEAMRTTSCAKHLVFASSGAYYGTTTTDRPIHEDDAPCAASNIYAPSKVAGDVAVRAYAKVYGIKAAVCRFMNTYGPGDTNFSRIVPRAIRNLIHGADYDFGDRDDGSTRLDYLYIRDMSNAYIKLAEHLDVATGEAFNFGRGHSVSTSEMTKLISRVFDGREREPLFHGPRREVPVVKYLDIQKAKRVLDWQPTTTLEQGVAETIDWYRRFLDQL